ncbi:MAG: magnesium-translocating P-type ATPase [Planctomycetia bacterium]|nr:magnesium-translocating P-type ATPase [Planctomycetia bacterium]
MPTVHVAFWSDDAAGLCDLLQSSPNGLTSADSGERLKQYGPNTIEAHRESTWWRIIWNQLRSPITLLLIFSAGLSLAVHEATEATLILVIIVASTALGIWQEHSASKTLETLLAMVQSRSSVWRDGKVVEVADSDLVVGDVLEFSAGAKIAADCRLLESADLFVNEATLTGETFPVNKLFGTLSAETGLAQRTNSLFCGTHVESGTGRAIIVRTGRETEFGHIAQRLTWRPPQTEFELGVQRFGYFLMELTLLLIVSIFVVNVSLHRPWLEAFLFSLALAVGLTPQLLPAIISVNLAHGARRMAEQHVIVRRLASIENFGSMDVLCSDKTGTLTEGTIQVEGMIGLDGQPSDEVRLLAAINAEFESGYANPIDLAIRASHGLDLKNWSKLGELPYDFLRKRLSILATDGSRQLLITKGAFDNVVAVCSQAMRPDGSCVPLANVKSDIDRQFHSLSERGLRVLGIAVGRALLSVTTPATGKSARPTGATVDDTLILNKTDEAEMTFVGFLVLHDPPKAGIVETIRELQELGVRLKMITGDNALVAANVAKQVGLNNAVLLNGSELRQLSDEALVQRVTTVDVFAQIEPNQKERIILALKKAGHVVGYLGDGINDAPALHAADVGISVDTAVDVAREAADIVLLKHDLGVLKDGIREGRITFANTLKYVFMATSANFGNMFSMAGISLFLDYLPLLPAQILLMNLLTDLPEMAIASDFVDPEPIRRPRRWNVREIRNFMLVFGGISSLFDMLTFAALLFVLHANEVQFRTGWFLESVCSAALIVLSIRTRRRLWESTPGRALLWATIGVVTATLLIPFSPLSGLFGFTLLPASFFATLATLLVAYLTLVEVTKRWFYQH